MKNKYKGIIYYSKNIKDNDLFLKILSSNDEINSVIVYGGNSSKKKNIYQLKICEPDGNLIKIIQSFKPNVVFNALHGRYGEDGYIQSVLEKERVNYTHSGVLASSIAIDKDLSKKLWELSESLIDSES